MATEPPASAGSVSRIECTAKIGGRGEAKVALFRHLAPITVNAILRETPFDSRVNVQPSMVCLFTDIRVGVEKPKVQLARGDVAFLPSGNLLCVFLQSVKSDRPLNPVGKVETGIEIFEAIRPGDTVRLSGPKEPAAQAPL